MSAFVWTRTDLPAGLGFVRLDENATITAEGYEIAVGDGQSWVVRFHVELDERWRTRRADVSVTSSNSRHHVVLEADGAGRWLLNGREAPHLEGCLDVDVAATPFTNSFVIRRLRLDVGESATVPVAWVGVPELTVEPLAQTYTRLPSADALHRYQYRDPRFGTFELTVDNQGVAVEYAGFARRVNP